MKIFILGLPQSGRSTVARALLTNEPINAPIIMDGVSSPKDFVEWFDPVRDAVVFLNRTNPIEQIADEHALAISVMRDYCLWLATIGKLKQEQWLEFNFPLPGDPQSDFSKVLGFKNTVIITKSIDKTIELIKDRLWK